MPVGVVMARDFLIVSFRHFPTVSADEHLKRSHFAGANQRLLEYGSEHVECLSRGDVAQAFRGCEEITSTQKPLRPQRKNLSKRRFARFAIFAFNVILSQAP